MHSLEIAKNLVGGIVPTGAHDATAGVSGRATQVEPFDGRAIVRVSRKRTQEEELVERHGSLKYVSSGEPVAILDVLGSQNLTCDHRLPEVRSVLVHDVEAPGGVCLLRVLQRASLHVVREVL